jgi:hypothetical protein
MDEIRSTLFSAGLRRLLTEALQPGEHVLWQDQPDGIARMMMWRSLWWIGFPWLFLTAIAISRGWIDQSTVPLLMVGIMMVTAPLVMLLHDLQTLFAITNRRALIVRTAWGKHTVTATRFEDMDAAFEILDIGRGAGHLNFALGRSTRSPDTDYTGRYGFRCVRSPSQVRDILERAMPRKQRARRPQR